jgi:hypothetical protein
MMNQPERNLGKILKLQFEGLKKPEIMRVFKFS